MNSRLSRIQNWSELAKANNYSVHGLARSAGVSPRQLERFFRSEFGVSPVRWLRKLRLAGAAELLARGAPVKETANELGFKNASHFSHAFKRQFGAAPQRFNLLDAGASL